MVRRVTPGALFLSKSKMDVVVEGRERVCKSEPRTQFLFPGVQEIGLGVKSGVKTQKDGPEMRATHL